MENGSDIFVVARTLNCRLAGPVVKFQSRLVPDNETGGAEVVIMKYSKVSKIGKAGNAIAPG